MSDFIVLIQSIERRYNIGLKQNKTNKTFTCEMCTHMQNRQMQSSHTKKNQVGTLQTLAV